MGVEKVFFVCGPLKPIILVRLHGYKTIRIAFGQV